MKHTAINLFIEGIAVLQGKHQGGNILQSSATLDRASLPVKHARTSTPAGP